MPGISGRRERRKNGARCLRCGNRLCRNRRGLARDALPVHAGFRRIVSVARFRDHCPRRARVLRWRGHRRRDPGARGNVQHASRHSRRIPAGNCLFCWSLLSLCSLKGSPDSGIDGSAGHELWCDEQWAVYSQIQLTSGVPPPAFPRGCPSARASGPQSRSSRFHNSRVDRGECGLEHSWRVRRPGFLRLRCFLWRWRIRHRDIAQRGIGPRSFAVASAACVAAAASVLISLPTFRLRGPYFAIATIGVSEAYSRRHDQSSTTGGAKAVIALPSMARSISCCIITSPLPSPLSLSPCPFS